MYFFVSHHFYSLFIRKMYIDKFFFPVLLLLHEPERPCFFLYSTLSERLSDPESCWLMKKILKFFCDQDFFYRTKNLIHREKRINFLWEYELFQFLLFYRWWKTLFREFRKTALWTIHHWTKKWNPNKQFIRRCKCTHFQCLLA